MFLKEIEQIYLGWCNIDAKCLETLTDSLVVRGHDKWSLQKKYILNVNHTVGIIWMDFVWIISLW